MSRTNTATAFRKALRELGASQAPMDTRLLLTHDGGVTDFRFFTYIYKPDTLVIVTHGTDQIRGEIDCLEGGITIKSRNGSNVLSTADMSADRVMTLLRTHGLVW